MGKNRRVGNAHRQIKEYIEERKIECTGKVYEVYNLDMSIDIYYELEQELK